MFSTVEVIMSTVGNHDACGGYHEYHGGVQYCGVIS